MKIYKNLKGLQRVRWEFGKVEEKWAWGPKINKIKSIGVQQHHGGKGRLRELRDGGV